MHVIAKLVLLAFWRRHPDAVGPLRAWHSLVNKTDFTDLQDVRRVFASADKVEGLTVFDIGGNKFRLITSIHYNRRKVYIRAVLTHAEYDRGNWKNRR